MTRALLFLGGNGHSGARLTRAVEATWAHYPNLDAPEGWAARVAALPELAASPSAPNGTGAPRAQLPQT